MKKIFSVAVLLLMMLTASAQDKPTVCVENFTNNSDLKDTYSKQLQNEIISGISATTRVTIVQPSSYGKLPKDPIAYEDALKAEGVNFILKGTLNDYTTGTSKAVLDKNKTYATAEVSYTLSLINLETHQTVSSDTESCSYATGSSAADALTKAIGEASENMKKYVDRHFKINATVKALDQIDPKKGAKTVYITIGSAAGITKGDILEVFAEVNIAGEKANKKIGEVKVNEVMSATLSLCNVKDGGVEIKNAFEDGTKITVITRAKKDSLFGIKSPFK